MKTADDSSFAWAIIAIILFIAFTIVFADDIWLFMDHVMTVEENFRR